MNSFSNEEIRDIRKGNNDPLGRLFKAQFDYCVDKISAQEKCSKSTAKDVFMDAIHVLRDKVLQGKFEHDNLRGFLLLCAKNKLRNKLKKDRRSITLDVISVEQYLGFKMGLSNMDHSSLSPLQQNKVDLIIMARKKLGDACRKLLELNFDQGYGLKELVDMLGYKSYDSVKTMKSKCIKQLRKTVADLLHKTTNQ